MNNQRPQKAVFLDRDGVINRCAAPHCYIAEWQDFELLPGVEETLKKLKEAGYLLIIVSNQRGIARGMLTEEQVERLHARLQAHLGQEKAALDGIYVCPHNIGECHCRKPDIGLFLHAEKDFDIDKNASWMVGDSQTDIEAGSRYGISTILIGSKQSKFGQDHTFGNLTEAGHFLAERKESR